MRFLAALLALGAVLSAQEKLEPFPKVDPYTKNGREKFELAGYVSLGPFRFGDDHTTAQVEATLAGVPLIWVETEHFVLGSALEEYDPEKPEEIAELKLELERLRAIVSDEHSDVRALRAEIEAIAHDPAPPDFENTAAALDRAGRLFHRNAEAEFDAMFELNVRGAFFASQRAARTMLVAGSATYVLHQDLHYAVLAATRSTMPPAAWILSAAACCSAVNFTSFFSALSAAIKPPARATQRNRNNERDLVMENLLRMNE